MPTPGEPGESENTYVMDSESGAEMARLMQADKLVTQAMGGVLSDLHRLSQVRRILDVACGPGGWALEVAFTHSRVEVVGVDLSKTMVQYANAQAKARGLNNVRFAVMDARQPLNFPDGWFDIVNGRFLIGFMFKEDWPKLVKELMRITRPGGVIRLTEFNDSGVTNSPALEKFQSLGLRAMYEAGRSFYPIQEVRNHAITPMLGYFLQEAGCQNIQEKAYILNFSVGTKAFESNYITWKMTAKQVQPFLLKMGAATQEELDALYEQMVVEMIKPDFRALWYITSVWGEKPAS